MPRALLNRIRGCPVMVAFMVMSPAAIAQSDKPWAGFYAGFNFGEASSHACGSWAPSGTEPITGFDNQSCAGNDFVFAGRFGENFQYGRFVWGLDANIGYWHGGSSSQSLTYPGGPLPVGTYSFSSRPSPSGFAIVGPRFGYAGNLWMPYVEIGGLFAFGSKDDTLTYTLASGSNLNASFSGGKSFSTTGWAGGAGFEWGLHDAWTINLEYLHLDLGKGSDTSASCAGTACALFPGTTFDNAHGPFTGNMIRIGFSYWFSYWDPVAR